jgi:hypothetical protein
VKAAEVYNLRNKGTDPTDRESQFGLVQRDFSPKPAYAAFSNELHALASAPAPDPSSPATGDQGAASAPPPPPQVDAGGDAISVTSTGVAPVPVACPSAGQTCEGMLRIKTRRIRLHRHSRKRRVKLAARRVRVKPGHRKIVHFTIPPSRRMLLARLGRVRVTVRATPVGPRPGAGTRKSRLTLHCASLRRAR